MAAIGTLTDELRHISHLDNFHRVGAPIGTHQITLGDDHQVAVFDRFLLFHQVYRLLVGFSMIGMDGGKINRKYTTVQIDLTIGGFVT